MKNKSITESMSADLAINPQNPNDNACFGGGVALKATPDNAFGSTQNISKTSRNSSQMTRRRTLQEAGKSRQNSSESFKNRSVKMKKDLKISKALSVAALAGLTFFGTSARADEGATITGGAPSIDVTPSMGSGSILEYTTTGADEENYNFSVTDGTDTSYYLINFDTEKLNNGTITFSNTSSSTDNGTFSVSFPNNDSNTDSIIKNVAYTYTMPNGNAGEYIDPSKMATGSGISWQEVSSGIFSDIEVELPDNVTKYYNFSAPAFSHENVVINEGDDGTYYNYSLLSGNYYNGEGISIFEGYNNNGPTGILINEITGNFINNSAYEGHGGAISTDITEKSVRINKISGSFIGNRAFDFALSNHHDNSDDWNEGHGGAIYLDWGLRDDNDVNVATVGTISGDFISNQATDDGGAIYNRGEITDGINARFINNVALVGGAIANHGDSYRGNLVGGKISSITGDFINNHANRDGGAIYNNNDGQIGEISGVFLNNTSDNSGGAINNHSAYIDSISGIFIHNSARYGAGAIHNIYGTIGEITADFIGNSSSGDAGAIWNNKSVIDVISGNFISNTGDTGGAIHNSDGSEIRSIGSNFINNISEYEGGAIKNTQSSTIEEIWGDFIGNKAKTGGAIYNENAVIKQLSDSNFINNSAVRNGGAIHNSYRATINVNYSSLCANFIDNLADNGGAIYNDNSATINGICDSNFIGNHANDKGGAIYNDYSAIIMGDNKADHEGYSIYNSTFINNSSGQYGGAIHLGQNSNTFFNSHNLTFIGNSSMRGGAISNLSNRTFAIDYSLFKNNSATDGSGGAIYNKGFFEIDRTEFNGNSAKNGGAIFAAASTETYIDNSVFKNNTASSNGGAIYAEDSSLSMWANSADVLFDNNIANGEYNDVYLKSKNGVASFSLSTFGDNTITFNGSIKGENLSNGTQSNPYVALSGTGSSELIFNNTIKDVDIKIGNTGEGGIKLGSNLQKDGTTSYGVIDNENVNGNLRVTSGNPSIDQINNHLDENKLGSITVEQPLPSVGPPPIVVPPIIVLPPVTSMPNLLSVSAVNNSDSTSNPKLSWAIDVDVENRAADTISVKNASSGIINISKLNFINVNFDNVTDKDFKIQILKTPNDNLQLTLSDYVMSQLPDTEFDIGTGIGTNVTYDEIKLNTSWNDEYYAHIDEITYYGKLGLATTQTTNDSIGVSLAGYRVTGTTDELADPLALVNQSDLEGRNYNAADGNDLHKMTTAIGVTGSGTFNINGIEDENGRSTIDLDANRGFKVYNNSTLTLNNVEITGARSYGFDAGAALTIDNENAQVNLNNVNFNDNKVLSGGTSADNAEYGFGGAVYIRKGHIGTITGEFSDNDVESSDYYDYSRGGAIAVRSYSEIDSINATFTNNGHVKGNSFYGVEGGAIYNEGEIGSIEGEFTQNKADNGGAIYNYNSSGTRIDIINAIFTENYASTRGGAIYNKNNINSIVGQFINNSVGNDPSINGNGQRYIAGGAIYNEDNDGYIGQILDDTIFEGNTVVFEEDGSSSDGGGAISNNSTIDSIGKVTFKNNSVTNTATGNKADASGGAIYNYNGYNYGKIGTINGASFTGNSVSAIRSNKGGAIYNFSDILQMNSVTFEDNVAGISSTDSKEAKGGAVFNGGVSGGNNNANYIGTLSSNAFKNNIAQGEKAYGGAIYNEGNISQIENTTFEGNRALGEKAYGGAMYNIGAIGLNGEVRAYGYLKYTATNPATGEEFSLWPSNIKGTFTSWVSDGYKILPREYTSTLSWSEYINWLSNSYYTSIDPTSVLSEDDYLKTAPTFQGSTFKGNYVQGTKEAKGGAIALNNADVGQDYSANFEGNYADGGSDGTAQGGALYYEMTNNTASDATPFVISGGEFKNNYVTGKKAQGGAIYAKQTHLTINTERADVLFEGNYAKVGTADNVNEAIYMEYDSAKGVSTLTLDATSGHSITLKDYINGKKGYKTVVTGDADGTINLYNDIKNSDVSVDTVKVNTGDGNLYNYTMYSLNSDANANWTIDLDVANKKADTFKTSNASSGRVTLDNLNIINGDLSATSSSFIVQVLKTQNDDLQLELSDRLKNSTEDIVIGSNVETSFDDVNLDTNWQDEYYKHDKTVTYLGKLGLATKTTTNDSIGVTISGTRDGGTVNTLLDTLSYVNQSDLDGRNFNFDSSNDTYDLNEDLGSTGAGTININGVPDDSGNKSTINLNNNSGFELANATTLNINNMKITGNDEVLTTTNSDAVVNLKNSEIDGNITNDGILNLNENAKVATISGSGTTNINSDFKVENAITGNAINLNNAELTFGALGDISAASQFVANNGARVNLQDGAISNTNLGNVVLNSDLNLKIDGHFAEKQLDTITVNSIQANDNHINISNISILTPTTEEKFSISPIGNTQDEATKADLANAIAYTGGDMAMTPIYKYHVDYDSEDGMLNFTRFAGTSATPSYKSFNPSILAAPVAAQAGAMTTMNQALYYSFEHGDSFMNKSDRSHVVL